jgi:hypothetical protein
MELGVIGFSTVIRSFRHAFGPRHALTKACVSCNGLRLREDILPAFRPSRCTGSDVCAYTSVTGTNDSQIYGWLQYSNHSSNLLPRQTRRLSLIPVIAFSIFWKDRVISGKTPNSATHDSSRVTVRQIYTVSRFHVLTILSVKIKSHRGRELRF